MVVGQGWNGWNSNVGGPCSSSPATTGDGHSNLWVFCRKLDSIGYVQAREWTNGAWTSWFDLNHGGWIETAPGATDYFQPGGTLHINVYGVGWDGNVYQIFYDEGNGVWSNWASLGAPLGGCTSGPNADWRSGNDLEVFCRGPDGAAWHTVWNGSAWSVWSSLGGVIYDSVGLTDQHQPDGWYLNAFVTGGLPNNVYQNWMGPSTGLSWVGWNYTFGGVCESGPDATDYDDAIDLWMSCRGSDNNLWYQHWNGASWSGWLNLTTPP